MRFLRELISTSVLKIQAIKQSIIAKWKSSKRVVENLWYHITASKVVAEARDRYVTHLEEEVEFLRSELNQKHDIGKFDPVENFEAIREIKKSGKLRRSELRQQVNEVIRNLSEKQ